MLEIADWFIKKQFNHCYDLTIVRVLKETDKAIFCDLYNSDTEEFITSWLPKSVITAFDTKSKAEEIQALKDDKLLDKFMHKLRADNGINEDDLPF